MKKILKLVILFIISMSVYYIYKGTKDSNTIILNIGDELAVGINSFGIDDYSYADYYKLKIESYNNNVEIINNYAEDNLSLKLLQEKLKNTNEIKKDLINSHILFICLGYNDLKYKLVDSYNQYFGNIQEDSIDISEYNDYFGQNYLNVISYDKKGIVSDNNITKKPHIVFISFLIISIISFVYIFIEWKKAIENY